MSELFVCFVRWKGKKKKGRERGKEWPFINTTGSPSPISQAPLTGFVSSRSLPVAGKKGTRGKGGLATEAFDRGLGSEPVRRWDRIRSFTGGGKETVKG